LYGVSGAERYSGRPAAFRVFSEKPLSVEKKMAGRSAARRTRASARMAARGLELSDFIAIVGEVDRGHEITNHVGRRWRHEQAGVDVTVEEPGFERTQQAFVRARGQLRMDLDCQADVTRSPIARQNRPGSFADRQRQ
jgi:hypothetical protein